ncbi:MAG: hypothetical protein HY314_11655 [Acidobacteria bacterium]|nr:hypothetical protein [Acidobacteriota bacterium]
MATEAPKPKTEIRRFDIFAEWNRLKARHRLHLSEADASAYGLAVAKVVAARKFYGYRPEQASDWKRRGLCGSVAIFKGIGHVLFARHEG